MLGFTYEHDSGILSLRWTVICARHPFFYDYTFIYVFVASLRFVRSLQSMCTPFIGRIAGHLPSVSAF